MWKAYVVNIYIYAYSLMLFSLVYSPGRNEAHSPTRKSTATPLLDANPRNRKYSVFAHFPIEIYVLREVTVPI